MKMEKSLMKVSNQKKTPASSAKEPGKKGNCKILFYDFIRLPQKRQVRTLSWGIQS